MANPDVFEIRAGRFRVAVGGDGGVIAAEAINLGDMTQLTLNDLPGAAARFTSDGELGVDVEALVVAEDAAVGTFELDGDGQIVVSTTGDSDVIQVDSGGAASILAEAVAVAWRQRLSDAADLLPQLTRAEADIVGGLALPGKPKLLELRAERRHAFAARPVETPRPKASVNVVDVVIDVADELRTGVRYGASALRAAVPDDVDNEVKFATAEGGWVQQLRLLLAVEEIVAIELALVVARSPDSLADLAWAEATRALSRLADERAAHEGILELLNSIADLVPARPSSPIKFFARRLQLSAWQQIANGIDAYRMATHRAGNVASELAAAEADDAIEELESMALTLRTLLSADEAASLLGEYFAAALPSAKEKIADLRQRHPHEDTKDLVARVKRQAIADLGRQSRTADDRSTSDIVVLLAMEIAVLRGVEPRSDADFADIGQRIVNRATNVDAWRGRAGVAMPLVTAHIARYARVVQPIVVELVFNAMAGVKPAQSGAAKALYKAARSDVWRARHNKKIAATAALGASRGLQIAISSGTARLLVRQVDKAFVASDSAKRGGTSRCDDCDDDRG